MAADPDDLVEVFKALGNPARLRILGWLRDPDEHFPDWVSNADAELGVCVNEIQAKAGLAQSTVSAYLSTLERAGLVRASRVGKWTYYQRVEERLTSVAEALGKQV
ncbi:ArsR/SmtB family transcription factor [Actinokineospora bangkokensis]|uniref:ArsR/SmtB family transcription factor n=1 Tax=Actinokineospora bangkokensis TaxID=1193682 RepID=UPI000B17B227|nr:metalloregulator ArsR/SmtB family transcription factor [Actinokineospora bangkokensis]